MPRNWLEWLSLAVGVIAVVVVVGILVADGVAGGSRPPDPMVQLHTDRAYQATHGWLLPATLTNEGDEAAEALLLVATATVDGVEERAEATIDYAPPRTAVELTFGFSARPDGDVEVRVLGFRLP